LLHAIKCNVATGSKADRPFQKFWVHIVNGAANIGVIRDNLHPVTDRTSRSSSSIRVFLG
jgi:hypothetical protein